MSKDVENSQDHYKDASDIYHSAFFYTGDYESWQLDILLKALNLKESDKLADIGGGTGRFASLLYKHARLNNPVMCVDPSPDMLSQAQQLQGVNTLCCNALEFSQLKDDICYDRILMKEVVHHLSEQDLRATLSSLVQKLSEKGKLAICTRPHVVEYPFFEAAHEVWKRNQPPKEHYVSLLEQSGYRIISVDVFPYPAKLNVSWWIDMVQQRFWSTFSEFNDEDLALGVKEIRRNFEKSETVEFVEKLVIIVAEKMLQLK